MTLFLASFINIMFMMGHRYFIKNAASELLFAFAKPFAKYVVAFITNPFMSLETFIPSLMYYNKNIDYKYITYLLVN